MTAEQPFLVDMQRNAGSRDESNESVDNRHRWSRWCSRWWKVHVAAAVLVGICLVLGLFFGLKPRTTNDSETGEIIPSGPAQLQSPSGNSPAETDTRTLRVSGKKDSCVEPFCKHCRVHVRPEPPTYNNKCDDKRYTLDIENRTQGACYRCRGECLNYTQLNNSRESLDCQGHSPKHTCCILAAVGNMDNQCNEGKLKCEERGVHVPVCECPLGKSGSRCELEVEANISIPCRCHKNVRLCEDDIPTCDRVHFNATGTPKCQMTYNNAGSKSYCSCYCNNTVMADDLQACNDILLRTEKLTNMGTNTAKSLVSNFWWLEVLLALLLQLNG